MGRCGHAPNGHDVRAAIIERNVEESALTRLGRESEAARAMARCAAGWALVRHLATAVVCVRRHVPAQHQDLGQLAVEPRQLEADEQREHARQSHRDQHQPLATAALTGRELVRVVHGQALVKRWNGPHASLGRA